jgi:hypothetical protein
MSTPHVLRVALLGGLAILPTLAPRIDAAPSTSPLTFSGDIRLRYEWDWDSQNAAGVARSDRDRARARARASLGYQFSSAWSFGARVRTGDRDSQQSPHLTFHANDGITDDFEVSPDRYFLQFKQDGVTIWGGRNTTPFWQQNEMYWDEDVTPTGLAASREIKLAAGTLTGTTGLFWLPDGAVDLHGKLIGAQVKYAAKHGSDQFTVAATLLDFAGKSGATHLRNRNGARDYLIGVLSAQWSRPLDTGRPLTLGVDLIKNLERYSAADALPFAARHADETDGYVLSASYGATRDPGDWQFYWAYGHIETLAVNAAYSQDDWARFSSGPQSDVTDIQGHELRGTYVITKTLNLQARLFLVEAVTSIQDGKRFRLDLNWRF